MDDQLVTIKSFSLPWEADLARATLEAQGIPAFVADAHTVSMNWLWSNAIGWRQTSSSRKVRRSGNQGSRLPTRAFSFRFTRGNRRPDVSEVWQS